MLYGVKCVMYLFVLTQPNSWSVPDFDKFNIMLYNVSIVVIAVRIHIVLLKLENTHSVSVAHCTMLLIYV